MKSYGGLFPEDTRIVELCSSIILLFSSFIIYFFGIIPSDFLQIQRTEFWSIYIFICGLTQFISIYFYTKLDLLRFFSSLICGALLIWLSLSSTKFSISDVGMFSVGIINIYAFIINSVQVKKLW